MANRKLSSPEATAVRSGEHACCRSGNAADRERLAAGFVRDGLTRGNRILYLYDDEPPNFAGRLESWDPRVPAATASGQLELRTAEETYLPDGRFESDRMIAALSDERERAGADGYAALSVVGEMTWALGGAPGSDQLLDFELRAGPEAGDGILMLCQYDESRFTKANTPTDAFAQAHAVDIGPELAPIGRGSGYICAADAGDLLRLCGALDFAAAAAVAAVVDRRLEVDLRFDLGDVDFIDVAGIRSLRGSSARSVTIDHASDSVTKLLSLLGWGNRTDIDLRRPRD